jgi:hypothetical protein
MSSSLNNRHATKLKRSRPIIAMKQHTRSNFHAATALHLFGKPINSLDLAMPIRAGYCIDAFSE